MPRFVPRQRKHKVLARESAQPKPKPVLDSNQEQIVPLSKSEREEKREKLREELRAQQPKISSKKQKRLDKYIENKLKKDETVELLQKLEKEKEKYDAAAAVQASKNLRKRSFNDFVHGDGPTNGTGKKQKSKALQDVESDVESEDSFEAEHRDAFESGGEIAPPSVATTAKPQGSGLANPLALDENGMPLIGIRRKSKKKRDTPVADPADLPWEGFGSEPSDYGSDTGSEESEGFSASDSDDLDSDEDDEPSDTDENTSGSDSETSTSDAVTDGRIKPRQSAWKAWATQRVNEAYGHVPSYSEGDGQLLPKPTPQERPSKAEEPVTCAPVQPEDQPLPNRKAYAVHVNRPEAIRESRSQLPILQREQEIMEAIHNNPVVLVKGDTGSGKTTQLPQFLFEAGYGSKDGPTPGMIGITQPRRVAAVSMAKRVGVELGNQGKKVGYQIRFDTNVSSDTAVKFMTDGILLRELSQDLLLRKYSAIIIDEAHERSVNTDILIGMLSKIVPARLQRNNPLKLVIMSATLNIGDFLHEKLFSPTQRPPIVEAEGRQHRVTTHFALRSRSEYVEEVIEKVTRAHKKLPHGGILVFLTGQNEIKQVADRLRQELVPRSSSFTGVNAPRVQIAASEAPLEAEDMDVGNFEIKEGQDDFEIDILTQSDEEEEAHEFEVSDDEDGDEGETQSGHASLSKSTKEPYTSVHVLPLYSQLPTTEQLKVFEPAPLGARMIVLATNVAETSLTIPGMRYVFDTGRSKERKYNLDSGVQSFEIDYISKASAQQRAGRAGRTGPGHCWRLYTSAVYEQFFPEHTEPEILRAPAESVVLQLKGFEYPLPVANFPFPTPPAASSLNKAEQLLRNLGALTTEGKITDLGRQLSMYPLSPRLGRIMAAGVKDVSMIWQVLSLVSSLAVSEIFITEAQLNLDHRPSESTTTDNGDRVYTLSAQQDDEARDNLKQSFGRARATLSRHDKTSDVLKLFTAVSMYLDSPNKAQFCTDYFLRPKAMAEIAQLHSQLESLIRANHRSTITQETLLQSKTTKLSTSRAKLLNTIAASGHIDNLAIRWDMHPLPPDMTLATKPRRAIDVAYIPLIPLTSSSNDPLVDKVIYIHPSSILSRLPIKSLPEYIVYSQLQRSQPKTSSLSVNDKPKIRMFPLTPLDAAQISLLARDTALVEYGKPVRGSKVEDVPAGSTDSSTGTGTGGGSSSTRKKRIAWVTCEIRGGKGMTGWPLPPVKVRQVFDVKSRSGWRVEEVLS